MVSLPSRRAGQRGFTYMLMLFAVAVAGALLAVGSVYWSQAAQRERENELLDIGQEFQHAIGLYYERTPGSVKRYPETLEDLLLDKRYLSIQRYLRRIYRDPMNGQFKWGMVNAPSGGIMGVHSLSADRPVKTGGFNETEKDFNGKSSYADWKFVYTPVTSQPGPGNPTPK